MVVLGLLMVSRVRYVHAMSYLTRRGSFFMLVGLVFAAGVFFAAPVPALFASSNLFVLLGFARYVSKDRARPRATPSDFEGWAGRG
jgi:hypothetical protein